MAVAVADSHALIWAALGPQRKLGARARQLFQKAEAGTAVIYVPAVSMVEIAHEFRRGTLTAPGGFHNWISDLLGHRGFIAVDLSLDIVLAAEALYAIPDRSDRLIAATALHLECPLITRDPEIARVAGLEIAW